MKNTRRYITITHFTQPFSPPSFFPSQNSASFSHFLPLLFTSFVSLTIPFLSYTYNNLLVRFSPYLSLSSLFLRPPVARYTGRCEGAVASETTRCRGSCWHHLRYRHVPSRPCPDQTLRTGRGTRQEIQVIQRCGDGFHVYYVMVMSLCRNVRHAFRTILKEEGGMWSGCLYRGIFPTLCGIAPYVGLNFAVYETLKGWRSFNPFTTSGGTPLSADSSFPKNCSFHAFNSLHSVPLVSGLKGFHCIGLIN